MSHPDDAVMSPAVSRTELVGDGQPVIRVRDLQHFFGEGPLRKQVLYDNNLEVARGEIVIMTGPSGSGKTTLLTLIGALRTVQEGSLEVLGHQLRGATLAQLMAVRRKLGFIFQAHNLFDSLTAFQNVRMGAELFGYGPRELHERIVGLLSGLGLGGHLRYKPGALSGGQKQRVAIARALVHQPKLILADEPTASLDAGSGREVVALFRQYVRQHGATILMVTHDNRILDVADRIVTMVDGRIKSNVLVQVSAQICQFLKDVPAFAKLTPRTLADAADRMKWERHPAGTVIFRQGEPGEKFYLIRSGRVDVVRTTNGRTQSVAQLGQGDFFGEAALLLDVPRNATIVALEDVELFTMDKSDFRQVLQQSATFEQELRKALFERQ